MAHQARFVFGRCGLGTSRVPTEKSITCCAASIWPRKKATLSGPPSQRLRPQVTNNGMGRKLTAIASAHRSNGTARAIYRQPCRVDLILCDRRRRKFDYDAALKLVGQEGNGI